MLGGGGAHSGTRSLSRWRGFEVGAVLSLRWSTPPTCPSSTALIKREENMLTVRLAGHHYCWLPQASVWDGGGGGD